MKIGLCAGIDKLSECVAAGFEYIELPVSGMAALSDEEYAKALADLNASGIKAEAFNQLFPGDLLLLTTGTEEQIIAYLEKAMARVHEMGGKVAVFGSGRSRRRPDDMPYDEAFRRLVKVTRLAGTVAAKHDVTIAIEPLNRRECNMINSVAEGACLAAMVDHPNVKVLADYYHVAKDNEPLDDMKRLGGVQHVHIASNGTRLYPTVMEEGYEVFVKALKDCGYDARISVEGNTDDLAKDGPASVTLLRDLWNRL